MIEKLGRYEILKEIGQGGFAIVYRVRDTELDRDVALKELRPALLHDPEGVKRFKREAKTIARLDHRRIVTIFDVVEVSKRLFIVMRMVDGPSLDRVIAERGSLSWPEALDILTAIAEGLDYAHKQNILHRDLKPANILLDPERGPLLSDFGLAKLAGDAGSSVTAAGGIVGTPHYIAPEVWEGKGTTRQSDIYALGCILYELLIGQTLFAGESPPAVMMAHFNPLQLPVSWPESVPIGLAEILTTALSKDPTDRYSSAGELVLALNQLIATAPQTAEARESVVPLVSGPESQPFEPSPVEDPIQSMPSSEVKGRESKIQIRHNLPPQPTPFIGREEELAALGELIANPAVRLVTIVGPGGMGKTRLTLATAERQLRASVSSGGAEGAAFLEESYSGSGSAAGGDSTSTVENPPLQGGKRGVEQPPATSIPNLMASAVIEGNPFLNGIYFVPLAPLSSVDHIIPTLAEALNFPLDADGQQRRTPKQQILDYLREKRMLIVMDNYEHLLDGVELVADILQAAPDVQILATSRERLHLHEEQVYPIQGLEFPDWETPEDAIEYTAVQLFLQSAQRVQPAFRLETKDLTYLTRICRLVEGMPLGIELAAAWVDMLSLADIATEIQQSLDFLETDVRNVPKRHRSMRAVFDYSWQHMSQAEQEIFPQLSIFRGGFTRQAAHEITGASLRLLGTLVSKSLLQFDKERDRYQIHELLRQYGAERLTGDHDTETEVRDRHSAYYLTVLQQHEAGLKGAGQQGALSEIEAEIENIRPAWSRAVARSQAELLRGAVDSLCLFYEWQGRFQEGELACREAVKQLEITTGSKSEPLLLARLLVWQSLFSQTIGQRQVSDEQRRRALELLDAPHPADQDSCAERAFVLARAGRQLRDADRQEGMRLSELSLKLYQDLGDRWEIAGVLATLASFARSLGNHEQAKQLYEESLATRQTLQDQRGITASLLGLSLTLMDMGQVEEAVTLAQRALSLRREVEDQLGVAQSLSSLGLTFIYLGRPIEARASFEESIEISNNLGIRIDVVSTTLWLTIVKGLYLGQYQSALDMSRSCLAYFHDIDHQYMTAMSFINIGFHATAIESFADAEESLQEGIAILRELGQRDEMSQGLAWLGIMLIKRDAASEAQPYLFEALQTTVEIRSALPLVIILSARTLLLVRQGAGERALALYSLITRHPMANTKWFEDVVGREVAATMATLAPDVVHVAQARGRNLDLWETGETLLAELSNESDNHERNVTENEKV